MQYPLFCCFATFSLLCLSFFNSIFFYYSTIIAWILLDKRKKRKIVKKNRIFVPMLCQVFYKFLKHKNLYIIVRETVYIDYIHIYIYIYIIVRVTIYIYKKTCFYFSASFFYTEIHTTVEQEDYCKTKYCNEHCTFLS